MEYTINDPEVFIPTSNSYVKKENFLFVQNTEDFLPFSKGDLKNIYYTIVNNGWKEFTFYCPSEYVHCLEDVKEISNDQDLLTHLNNYVHPFNGFSNVKTVISESGDITVSISYFYSDEQIKAINKKIDEIYKNIITCLLYTSRFAYHRIIIKRIYRDKLF